MDTIWIRAPVINDLLSEEASCTCESAVKEWSEVRDENSRIGKVFGGSLPVMGSTFLSTGRSNSRFCDGLPLERIREF